MMRKVITGRIMARKEVSHVVGIEILLDHGVIFFISALLGS